MLRKSTFETEIPMASGVPVGIRVLVWSPARRWATQWRSRGTVERALP